MGRLVFNSTRGDSQDIWLLEAGSDEPRQLTTDEATDRVPALSPDGSTVIFSSDRVGGPDSPSGLRTYGLYVVGVDGSEAEHLLGERTFNSGARYSPDGSQIGFGSDASGIFQVYVMNADGSGSPEALTDDPVQADMGDWSPDGQQIVFTSLRDSEGTDYNREIYVMNADGSDQIRLTDDPGNDSSPAWSPDGEWIVFSSERSGNAEIHIMRPDGTDVRQLTDHPADDRFPTWSPDGSMIAWDTVRDGHAEIYVMNADGSGQLNVTNNPAEDQFPDWGPG